MCGGGGSVNTMSGSGCVREWVSGYIHTLTPVPPDVLPRCLQIASISSRMMMCSELFSPIRVNRYVETHCNTKQTYNTNIQYHKNNIQYIGAYPSPCTRPLPLRKACGYLPHSHRQTNRCGKFQIIDHIIPHTPCSRSQGPGQPWARDQQAFYQSAHVSECGWYGMFV